MTLTNQTNRIMKLHLRAQTLVCRLMRGCAIFLNSEFAFNSGHDTALCQCSRLWLSYAKIVLCSLTLWSNSDILVEYYFYSLLTSSASSLL